jgi:hypothetical protein
LKQAFPYDLDSSAPSSAAAMRRTSSQPAMRAR